MNVSSPFALMLRKLGLLFHRDLAVARSYRAAFAIELFQALFGSASFYFLSRFVESPALRKSLPPGTTYFSFALVGIAFFDYLSVALTTFDASLQEARQNGTLENLLSHTNFSAAGDPGPAPASTLFRAYVVAAGDLRWLGQRCYSAFLWAEQTGRGRYSCWGHRCWRFRGWAF